MGLAHYNPNDKAFTLTFTVADAGGTYNGDAFPATATVTGSNGVQDPNAVSYSYSGTTNANVTYGPTAAAPTEAGSYTVTATVAAGGDFRNRHVSGRGLHHRPGAADDHRCRRGRYLQRRCLPRHGHGHRHQWRPGHQRRQLPSFSGTTNANVTTGRPPLPTEAAATP